LPYSILIVDDSTLIRRLLRSYIEPHRSWQVCGEAENGKVAVEKVKELRPDVVILDYQMPVMNGIEAARQIARLAPNTAMVMLTMHNSETLAKDAQAAGIKDVLSKSDEVSDHLIASLRNVVASAGS
jgi:DNA-binding NarL/FixJ family response regulator